MKGRDLAVFWIIFVLAFIAGCFFTDKSYKAYSDISTFLSILIGFQITSLSIIFNSNILKILFRRTDRVYGTELLRLSKYFKFSIAVEVIYVILVIAIGDAVIEKTVLKHTITLHKHLLVFPILFTSAYCLYKVSKDLFRIFELPRNEN